MSIAVAPPRIAPNPHPPGGSPPELRESIAELMSTIELRAGIVRSYAQIDDDAGLAYGIRCLTAELKAALGLAGLLAEITEPERARRRTVGMTRNASSGRPS